jgi:methionyl-tRNA formyltransferase
MKFRTKNPICIGGKNEIAVYGLKLLLEKVEKVNLRVVCNQTDDGFDNWQPSLLKVAIDNDISVVSIEDCYDLDGLIFLSLEFDKIISPAKFINASLYNIHFSNLPAYKGMYTSTIPLLKDEKEAGVTLHHIDSGIDTGDIIDQVLFNIDQSDTAKNLYEKYLSNSKILLERNIEMLLDGSIASTPQSAFGSSYFSKQAIDYKNVNLDLNCTANQICNQVRAYTFPEYQVPKVHGYYVNSSKILNVKSLQRPGALLKVNEEEVHISSVDYDVILNRDLDAELFEAAASDNEAIALACIASGADVNKRNGRGWTPLIVASFNGSISVMKALIKSGADIDKSNYKGTTPLMYAMTFYEKSKQRLAFDTLIEFGANKELRDMRHNSIEDYADDRGVLDLFN